MVMSPPIHLSTLEKDPHTIIYFLMNNMMEFRMNMFCVSFQQIMNGHVSYTSLFVLINFLLLVFLHINMFVLLEMLQIKCML